MSIMRCLKFTKQNNSVVGEFGFKCRILRKLSSHETISHNRVLQVTRYKIKTTRARLRATYSKRTQMEKDLSRGESGARSPGNRAKIVNGRGDSRVIGGMCWQSVVQQARERWRQVVDGPEIPVAELRPLY